MSKSEQREAGVTPRRQFDENYKRHAVELTLRGDRTVKAVAKELGIPAWALYEWRKQHAARGDGDRSAPRTLAEAEQEIADLRDEVMRLRERETILKKSMGILSETPGSGMPRSRR